MRIISRKTLKDFWETHADAAEPLKAWFHEAKVAEWKSFLDIKTRYRSCLLYTSRDLAGDCDAGVVGASLHEAQGPADDFAHIMAGSVHSRGPG